MSLRRYPHKLVALLQRLLLLSAVLLAGGFAGALLVRVAPGFGADERMLDPRLSNRSIEAIGRDRAAESDVLAYYANYLRRMAQGDLGDSASFGRPVAELLSERVGVSLRSTAAGLALAWAGVLFSVFILDLAPRQPFEAAASLLAGAALCVPAAVVALACFHLGGTPAAAIACILGPRLFRYVRNVAQRAWVAPHVLAARAFGQTRLRILALHVLPPVLPELFALAGVSGSMAVGTLIAVEALCDSPGVGQLVWQAALARDLPVIVNVTLLITAVTAVANCMADAGRTTRQAEC
jgi:peptide/nickel transport system permease protein